MSVAKLQGDKSASQSSMELYYPWIPAFPFLPDICVFLRPTVFTTTASGNVIFWFRTGKVGGGVVQSTSVSKSVRETSTMRPKAFTLRKNTSNTGFGAPMFRGPPTTHRPHERPSSSDGIFGWGGVRIVGT